MFCVTITEHFSCALEIEMIRGNASSMFWEQEQHSFEKEYQPSRPGWKESKRTNANFLRCILDVKFPPFLLIGLRSVEKKQIIGTRTCSSVVFIQVCEGLRQWYMCGTIPCPLLMLQGLFFTCLQVQNYSEHCRFLEKRLSGLHK